MSGVNGDKSRHNRMRKHRISQRARVREMKAELASAGSKKAAAGSPKKSAKKQ